MYRTILLPTDGSAPARAALDRALEFAETYDADLHALYVVDAAAFGHLDPDASIIVNGFEAEGRQVLQETAEAAANAGVSCETAVVHGSPHEGILEYADDHDVDLIVMGTHGRRGLDRFLLGSVTERVIRGSSVPVLTVRARED
ncbi:universal stress protein [Natronomonas sp. EA1]|uniref:universal stress protein n=1 Tax=Natronomonas sp. EA1 TaxID=3421655 RepID=UPI003EB9D02D